VLRLDLPQLRVSVLAREKIEDLDSVIGAEEDIDEVEGVETRLKSSNVIDAVKAGHLSCTRGSISRQRGGQK